METNNSIRVLIVDDHEVLRSSLKRTLALYPDIKQVGEAENGIEAIHFCTETPPDIIVMDLSMPLMNGAAATRILRVKHPQIGIILWSISKDQILMEDALLSGANCILLKNPELDSLVACIREVHEMVSKTSVPL